MTLNFSRTFDSWRQKFLFALIQENIWCFANVWLQRKQNWILLGWCKSNCGFALLTFAFLILEYILKYGYVIHHFNGYFSLYFFFPNDLLLAVYFIYILYYGYDVRQKFAIWVIFLFKFKWIVEQCRQLATSTAHLVQELLMNIQCSGGSRCFAKDVREPWRWGAQQPAIGSWRLIESSHWNWSSYNYTRGGWRTQCQPFYDCLAFEANWRSEKIW